jgi:hypothetical protein
MTLSALTLHQPSGKARLSAAGSSWANRGVEHQHRLQLVSAVQRAAVASLPADAASAPPSPPLSRPVRAIPHPPPSVFSVPALVLGPPPRHSLSPWLGATTLTTLYAGHRGSASERGGGSEQRGGNVRGGIPCPRPALLIACLRTGPLHRSPAASGPLSRTPFARTLSPSLISDVCRCIMKDSIAPVFVALGELRAAAGTDTEVASSRARGSSPPGSPGRPSYSFPIHSLPPGSSRLSHHYHPCHTGCGANTSFSLSLA